MAEKKDWRETMGAPFEESENPEYNVSGIRKTTTETPAHADMLNGIVQGLIDNTAAVKKIAESKAAGTPEFEEAETLGNIQSGDTMPGILGKLKKWYASLHRVAWSGNFSDLENVPSAFPAASHTHDDRYFTESEVTTKLAGKSDTSHTHTASQVGAATSNHTHNNYATIASPTFTGSISLGRKSGTTVGDGSAVLGTEGTAGKFAVAEGDNCSATGEASHAEGGHFNGEAGCIAQGYASHAEGMGSIATARGSHAENSRSHANGEFSHSEGSYTFANGRNSHAEGNNSVADGDYSHAGGCYTIAHKRCQTAIGAYNNASDSEADVLIVGSGLDETKRANAFRVTTTGVYDKGNYNASGADYAELFEWADKNPQKEGRAGHFVTLDGEKIRIATPADEYILGIVSGSPSVVGDVYDDQWAGMFETDIFGRPVWEDVDLPAETMEEPDPENPGQTITREILPARTEHRQKVNPKYDHTQKYIPRTERPEWDAVGLLGKLVAVDDGSCQVNGWCKVGEGGIAVHSEQRTPYRVMARLDDTHIRILLVPSY